MADKKFMRKWVAALRSGKYKQVKGALRYDDGFCCLGVACKLMASIKKKAFSSFTENTNGYLAGSWLLPRNLQIQLAELNDHANWSFNRIAKFIEKTYITNSK